MRVYEFGVVADTAAGAPVNLRLFATDEPDSYHGYSITIVDQNGESLNERLAKVLTIDRAHTLADYYEENDVRYAVRACAYHVERIALRYSETTQRFEEAHPMGTALRGNTSDPRVYYEVDAFLGSGQRYYEHLRRLLWKYFGKGTPPRSFRNLLSLDVKLPEPYRSTLHQSWAEYGSRLKGYRDCISHYVPLDSGMTTCWLTCDDGRWA